MATTADTTDTTESTTAGPVDTTRDRRVDRRTLLLVGLALASLATLVGPRLVAVFRPHLYTGTVFQAGPPAPPLDGLHHADGTPAALGAYDGDLLLVFFGYANCPDVCPAVLSKATVALEELGPEGDRVDVLLIGVDPARDTSADLERYVDAFDPRFTSATGEEADVARVASLYGIYAQPSPGQDTTSDDYTIDHTASLTAIDADGRLRVVWGPDVDIADLAADLDALL